jgi:alpha-tubulin suppressor-like RCC1 family protein
VLAWGLNGQGQLGNGNTTDQHSPVQITIAPGGAPVGKVTGVSAGCNQSLAITSRGVGLAWGFGGDGQLGNGSTADHDSAVRVALPAGVTATSLRAGCTFSLALTSAGHALAWGTNSLGQLGDGSVTGRDKPVSVKLAKGLIAIAIAAGATAQQGFAIVR